MEDIYGLESLKKLKDAGHLSEAEFQQLLLGLLVDFTDETHKTTDCGQKTSKNSPKPNKRSISKRTKIIIIAVLLLAVFAGYNVYRDIKIQEGRDAYTHAVAAYESDVRNKDRSLAMYESEIIDLSILDNIVPLQEAVIGTSNLLIELNGNVYSWQYNPELYQSQMASLNAVIGDANKKYEINEISSVEPVYIPRPTERKFFEILHIEKPPQLSSPSQDIEEINNGISARYEAQKAIRDAWAAKAQQINSTQDAIRTLRENVYALYGTNSGGGVYVQTPTYVEE